ncbi:hypothetical protein LCGC14_1006360 [marine sediment metagenome]|uniref:Uncharacterized protein n=1 Tax=marine sediment metagenome TaxID=412755 RepID=A0A0F9NN15_9ZZZZ
MPKQERHAMSPPRVSFSATIAHWMAIFGEAYGQEVSPERIAIYKAALIGEFTPEEFAGACQAALKICRFFPSIADILAVAGKQQKQIQEQEQARDELEAKKAWDWLQDYIAEWGAWRQRLMGDKKWIYPPELPAAIAYAAGQCGGFYRVATATTENVHFIRRDFLASFHYYRETAALSAPSREEAKRLLGKVRGWGRELPAQSK